MKLFRNIGLSMFVLGFIIFSSQLFFNRNFYLTPCALEYVLTPQEKENLLAELIPLTNIKHNNHFILSNKIINIYNKKNDEIKLQQQWDKVMWGSAQDFAYKTLRISTKNYPYYKRWLIFFSTIFLCPFGGIIFILSKKKQSGYEYTYQHHNVIKKGLSIALTLWLLTFYILLYWFPSYTINWIVLVDPISKLINGQEAGPWFLYGFLYSIVMSVMAIAMFRKYKNNTYQIIRTSSVLFFQLAFAFLIPELLTRLNMPYMDFKNIWPLDYDFFFDWNINTLIQSGKIGVFMLAWGIALIIIAVPIFTYFFGKRWYCSWVCGCGGLAETLGDPFRHLSDKRSKAWKFERILIYPIFAFSIIMTMLTLYTFFSNQPEILGIKTYEVQKIYGFLIGSLFAGVIGTGLYPILGNRVWCRFGCPLAAYMGIIQRFKSRYRITSNGAQCISCGNCSTYCEMGIDVRRYAQKGEDIIRASCVGCGICASVCPRGVLKLENSKEKRFNTENPIIINTSEVSLIK
jgi:polyferredoxin